MRSTAPHSFESGATRTYAVYLRIFVVAVRRWYVGYARNSNGEKERRRALVPEGSAHARRPTNAEGARRQRGRGGSRAVIPRLTLSTAATQVCSGLMPRVLSPRRHDVQQRTLNVSRCTARRTAGGARASRRHSSSPQASASLSADGPGTRAQTWQLPPPWYTSLVTLSWKAAASAAGPPTCTLIHEAGCCMHAGRILNVRAVHRGLCVAFASSVSARLPVITMWQVPGCPALAADAATRYEFPRQALAGYATLVSPAGCCSSVAKLRAVGGALATACIALVEGALSSMLLRRGWAPAAPHHTSCAAGCPPCWRAERWEGGTFLMRGRGGLLIVRQPCVSPSRRAGSRCRWTRLRRRAH